MDRSKGTPNISVVPDIKSLPFLVQYGSGGFTDLHGSRADSTSPLVAGIWYAEDFDNHSTEFQAEWDEVKYIIMGQSRWKDVISGQLFEANEGSVIWFPKGARAILVQSKNLKAFYVEQTFRLHTDMNSYGEALASQLNKIHERTLREYVANNPKSRARFEAATELMPGGNTRSVLHYDPFPLALSSGQGCHVTSLDGQEYLDCVSEFSAAMFGHSNPDILEAIKNAMASGINLGGPGEPELELARSIKRRFPSIDKLRYCNSGTEANTMALALAKSVTNRKKILAFENAYHGGTIGFGARPLATTIPHDYVLGRFNDIEYTKSLLNDDLAAIIVEPMQGAGGIILANVEFLQFLRDAATKHGAILIFDEVVTSRLHFNGLQGHFGVSPDITTLGKYIGGGPSFGAFGGAEKIMQALDPRSESALPHSGTYNNNVFTMAAGVAASKLLTEEKIAEANRLGDKLRDGMNAAAKSYNAKFFQATGFGSVVGLSVSGTNAPVVRDSLFFYLLSRNVYMGKRGFFSLNLAHKEQHIHLVLQAFNDYLKELFPEPPAVKHEPPSQL